MIKKPVIRDKLKKSDIDISILFEERQSNDLSYKRIFRSNVLRALELLGYPKNRYSVSFFICSVDKIKRLNRDFLQKNSVTNVLSWPQVIYNRSEKTNFPIIPHKFFGKRKEIFLGDIAISIEYCEEESINLGVPFSEHFKLLVMHSILHLLGFDHECDKEAKIMDGLQKTLLSNSGANR